MSIQSLPQECVSHIFEILHDEKDDKSLFSCLQVNRDWCIGVVPILYRKPFAKEQRERSKSRRSKLISTYLSCLTEVEKDCFMKINEIRVCLNTKPLFDYPVYLEEFCNEYLGEKISNWIMLMIKNISLMEQQQLLQMISSKLYPLLISKSKNLTYLKIVSVNSDIPNIYTFLAYPGLENISRFDFTSNESELSNITRLVKELPSRCKNIRTVNFNYKLTTNEDGEIAMAKALCKLIETQSNLNRLYLKFKGKAINHIMIALKSKSHSLTYLYLKKLRLNNDTIHPITSCESLEVLGFESCFNTSREGCKYFADDAKFRLKKLYLVGNKISEFKCLIIQAAGQSLQSLIIDEIDSDLIAAILCYCSNVDELLLMASEYKNIDLYNLLMKLRYLRKLTLWSTNEYIMQSLGSSLPGSLKHLGFINSNCTSHTFDRFLNECNVQIESLELFNFVHFTPISEYVKGHYNHLRVIYFGNSSDMIKEELSEIDKIKEFVKVKFMGKDYKWIPDKFI
ncbi:10056_t:CDS:1 [Funneliformis caledonium]|uniref:10056_t:CDS:1 n=1 Tax=Funneliformis caledonium TaxID=1117310 RepID=A0A9N8YVD9_9GLOM|nr:10056_t:CDS:1 [Funneliformis caledonium]